MADIKDLDFGIQNTEEFSMDDSSSIEDFLNGDTSKIEKIDPKKESRKEEKKIDSKASVKKEEEEVVEEKVDLLEELSKEDEDEEDSTKKKTSKEDDDAPVEETENHFEVMSRQLYDMGIFLQDEDEEPVLATSGEEFAQLFQQNAQKSALRNLDNFLRSRGDDRMDLFEAIFVNGVDPKEYLPVYNKVQDFEQMDVTQESNQEKVVREYYRRLKWDESKIENKVTKLKDYGDLEEEATEMHSKLVEQDKEELEAQKTRRQQEEQIRKQSEQLYQQTVQKTLVEAIKSKELSGFPLTEQKAREVASYLLKPQYKLPNGEVISECDKDILEGRKPENVKDRILFALLKLNNFDFSKIEKKAITTKTNELFSGLNRKAVKSKTEKVIQKDPFWDSL